MSTMYATAVSAVVLACGIGNNCVYAGIYDDDGTVSCEDGTAWGSTCIASGLAVFLYIVFVVAGLFLITCCCCCCCCACCKERRPHFIAVHAGGPPQVTVVNSPQAQPAPYYGHPA
ncbi:hypothetical protein LSAT2_022595 [Lamellibrachia satsuma]|nr:hypothetical protein LSAT2_022595 [Lamellibrachia satsuma]